MSVELAHEVTGADDAPVVVLGSSLGTTRAMWDEQVSALSTDYRVVRYDHRGHGGSPVPAGPYALQDLADDVLALLDRLDVEKAHLVGLSLGGMVTMQVAGTAPARVDRIALVCTAASMPPEPWRERAAAVRDGGTASVADAVASRWFTPQFAATARAQALREVLRGVPSEGYAGCCEAIAAMELLPLLPRVSAPALVVAGALDPATPPEKATEIVRLLGGPTRLEVLEGAAHLASVEKPEAVTRLLLDHLGGAR